MAMKVLIIGGVAAGTKVGAKLKRELGDDCQVTILNKGRDISYAGCGLPYYVGDLIHKESDLLVNTPQSFAALTGVEVKCGMEALALDRGSKQVLVRELATGEEKQWPYDKLVLAVGADPVRPPIPGLDLEGVYFMRTPSDATALRGAVEAGSKRCVVVGGGFIGLEIAENLSAQGLRVTVLDMAPQVMPGFDKDFADYVENHLTDQGINLFLGDGVQSIEGEGKVERVRTGKRAFKTDLVVMSAGIRPNTAWLRDTGLEFAPNGTLMVDEHMRTADPDIYAVGDCAMIRNRLTGQPAWSPMGSSANIEGRMCALEIAGKDPRPYPGALGTTVVRLPGLNAGKTGLGADAARQAGYDAEYVTIAADDKAHYFPGADNFIIRMGADRKTGKLLGVQVLGPGAVDKIVDIAVTAISLGATLEQLEYLDFAYAPPFSTAIHPFATCLNVLLNKMSGAMKSLTWEQARQEEGWVYVDVAKAPSVPGLPYVPVSAIKGPLEGIDPKAKVLLICTRGRNSYMAQNRLRRYGYENTAVLEGGTVFQPGLAEELDQE